MTHHFAMTSSLLINILKIVEFGVFSSDIDFKIKMDIFRDDIYRLINQFHPPGDRREPPADTKCPPAAQRKQAIRACILYS